MTVGLVARCDADYLAVSSYQRCPGKQCGSKIVDLRPIRPQCRSTCARVVQGEIFALNSTDGICGKVSVGPKMRHGACAFVHTIAVNSCAYDPSCYAHRVKKHTAGRHKVALSVEICLALPSFLLILRQ